MINELKLISKDYHRYCKHLEIEHYFIIKRIVYLLLKSTFLVVFLFRLASSSNRLLSLLMAPLYKLARIFSGIQIPRYTAIGGGILLPHFGCIVLNKRSVIGENCTILHNVTMGAKGGGIDSGLPVIGNNVYIGSSAILLGSVVVGDNVTIGAGSVVTRSIPNDHIAYGNPAKLKNK